MKGFKGFLKAMMAAAMSVTMTLTAFGGGGIGSPCTVYAATDTVVDTGQCGDALTYTVTGDEESGYAMAITGTGDMNNYGLDEWAAPWRDYNFKSISIGDGVTSIGDYAFVLNGNKVKLTIGKKVKSIGECAFLQTGITGTLTIPASVQTIGESAFEETAITKLVLGKGIKELGNDAFCDTPSLKSVDASKAKALETIGRRCFAGDVELNTIKINANKLKTVGSHSLDIDSLDIEKTQTLKITVIAKSKNKYNKAVTLINKGRNSYSGGNVYLTEFKFSYKKG